jgi:thiol-disulfide isomerase/thioredoxin
LGKIAVAAVVTFVLYEILSLSGKPAQHPGVGQKLGEVSFAPLSGDPPSLGTPNLAGHVVLMNFWGPWCPPCRMELPHLVAIKQDLAARQDFLFVPVACGGDRDTNSELDDLRRQTEHYLAEAGLTLATYADPNATTRSELLRKFGMKNFSYPFTLLLDREGVVRGVWTGYFPGSEKEIEKQIRELLGA